MPERVYECDKTQAEALKKVLEYDPYLDPNLITQTKSEKDMKGASEEEKKAWQEQEDKNREALSRLEQDKYANVIFARQEYDLRDGVALDLDMNKVYLYLKASDEFLGLAEERFKKEFKTIKRSDTGVEEKIIGIVKAEQDKASAGFGAIFGS